MTDFLLWKLYASLVTSQASNNGVDYLSDYLAESELNFNVVIAMDEIRQEENIISLNSNFNFENK